MALKSLRVAAAPATKSKKTAHPVLELEGNLVSRYNEAKIALEAAKAQMDEIEPELKSEGMAEFFALAVANPSNAPTSVKLVDSKDAVVMLTFADAYTQADGEAVDAAFAGLGADCNDYARAAIKVAFNSAVFIGKNGDFDTKTYNAFAKAIEDTAKRLGVENPLSGKEVVGPKEGFHQKRFSEFPTVEAQIAIQAALPAQVRLKAVIQAD